jgi:cytochrome c553
MNRLIRDLALAAGLFGAITVMAQAAGSAEAGQAKTALCAGCHGADGNSAVSSFPKLAGQGEKYLLKQMRDVKSGARVIPEMTGMLDGLTEQDLEDIAAYFSAQKMVVAQARADGIEQGRSLYRAGNPATGVAACFACHGPAGLGIELAVFPPSSSCTPSARGSAAMTGIPASCARSRHA